MRLRHLILISLFPFISSAQGLFDTGIHGNFEFLGQIYRPDSAIGAPNVPEKFLNNGYLNLMYEKGKFSAGLRYESYRNPILGFDPRYQGSGIPYRFITFKNDELEVTVGNFYDQFGSGIIFRSYEERGLGYDNAMEGVRVKYNVSKGLTAKGLVGKQRDFFTLGEGIVRGFDAEWNLNESFAGWAEKNTKITIGGSFVSKYQADDNNTLILPENVAAGAGRFNLIYKKWTINAEVAYKVNDPSFINQFIYKSGNAVIVNATYSTKGFGMSFGAKRIDNMAFRSDRNAIINSLLINYLPAMTRQHTNILATYYPYATQPNGEYGFQGELFFHVPEGSLLGGKTGADLSINYSRAQSIFKDVTNVEDPDLGYTSKFFKLGSEVYYEDFNVEYNRKLNKKTRLILTYVFIHYNKDVIEGRQGYGHIYSHTGIAEVNYKITKKRNLRCEVQHMYTKQDFGSWVLGLVEYTIAPNWFIAGFDMYNYGNHKEDERFNYYNLSAGYTKNANRIAIGYGRQRQGLFCVGGVCRTVPASNGFNISITSSF